MKLSVAGLAGLFSPKKFILDHQGLETHGRVIDDNVSVYSRPSLNAENIASYWKDMTLPIIEVTIGDEEPAHNRIWYRIDRDGYVHSGQIQPVRTQLNPVVSEIPSAGRLAEVTVPFTDAHWEPNVNFPVAYRFYYETTHWVTGLVYSDPNTPWYRIYDDKWKYYYYAPATHLRLIPDEELTPLSPHIPSGGKRIEVRTEEQVVIAYEWDRPVFMTRTATGARFSNGDFRTPPGRHITSHKRPFRHMAAGNLAYNGYDLPGVPWVCYITENGISFHGTYWHNNYGLPRSHGCINLTPKAAKWIFRWTLPYVPPQSQYVYEEFGTAVDVI
ncbi:MAG TPA: L,D-transpeptidase [Anaerolineales bacterium]|nr:L,D-transpeptidase [Anaerolineales bacterium]